MNQSEMVLPPQQQVFEFARTDVWRQLPATVQESCLRLLVQQMKRSLEYDHKETDNE